ncbi:MAG: 16S rRNA (guanine(527)-N(7))-methyltransferase RsmG [Chloroflexi bacterium]|nr:16S rRNA (guanine(527)-N(7))-methyltransferase RsmG [Chloroflexota bacterium]
MNSLAAGARGVGIDLDSTQQAAFQSYFRLLDERGRFVNLTAVRGWEAVREELFLRSLRVLAVNQPPLPQMVRERGFGIAAIDVGTGAGVPGLVLKIALPLLSMTLLDATRKKTDFLADAVRELGLEDVRIVNARAEEAARDTALREAFDVVLARSLARLPELVELTVPLCRIGGIVVAPKGADLGDEVAAAGYAVRELGASAPVVVRVDSPGAAPADSVIILRKIARTPRSYPRRPGLPHQRPLVAREPRAR